MKKNILRTLAAVAAFVPLLSLAAWPDKPIRMVVPYAAGGGADNTARLVAQQMSATLGQQIIIDNRPGAGGVIGAENVSKATPDGYTVLFDASAFSVNPSLRKLPFDALKDFIPVSLVATAPQILVVPANAPYKTIAQFLDYIHKNPAKLSFASAGGGSASHMAGETLNELAKVNLMHVPYKGGAPALTDVMGEQVSMYFGNAASTLGYVKTGKLLGLAVSSAKRMPDLPNTPTLAESGLAGFNVIEWNGVFLPKGTSPEIVQQLSKAVQAAVNDPKVKSKLLNLGLVTAGSTPDEFGRFVKTEIDRVGALVKARNIKVD
jgi:tripartite-type tricarboxylate transporter receptor subunit TctC